MIFYFIAIIRVKKCERHRKIMKRKDESVKNWKKKSEMAHGIIAVVIHPSWAR